MKSAVKRSTVPDPALRRGWLLLGSNLGDVTSREPKAVRAIGDNRVYLVERRAGHSDGLTMRRAVKKERGKKARRRDKLERRVQRDQLTRLGVE